MVIMAIDHAGTIFDRAGHLGAQSDSPFLYAATNPPLPLDRFFTRFVTHICAPTFVFLAGTSAALSAARRADEAEIDRHLLLRGGFIAALDVAFVSVAFSLGSNQGAGFLFILQVLFAIGAGLAAMAALRRLGQLPLLGCALATVVLAEPVIGLFWTFRTPDPPVAGAILLCTGFYGPTSQLIVLYPLLPWLAMMMLGWVFGRHLLTLRAFGRGPERTLLGWGIASLVVFVLLRGWNGYGNMELPRADGSLVQWLHVSKYPPSLTFTTLTLGAMALCLAGFFRWQRSALGAPWTGNPLLVFGQVPLFFYLLHFLLLGGLFWLTGWTGLAATYAATVVVVAWLYPVCVVYRDYKARHPGGWTRYL